MNKKFSALTLLLLLGTVGTVLYVFRQELVRKTLEHFANTSTQDLFAGSVKIDHASLDRGLQLHVSGLSAAFQTRNGKIPLVVREIHSDGPVTDLSGSFNEVLFKISGIVIADAEEQSLNAEVLASGGRDWRFSSRARLSGLDLAHLRWMDPESLKDATGKLTGIIEARGGASINPSLSVKTEIRQPGGNLQAKFFEMLTPYLPQIASRETLDKIRNQRLIRYKQAELSVKTLAADKMKVFLHILVPDYNLNLNLNIELRTDKENAFLEAAQILGLIEIKPN